MRIERVLSGTTPAVSTGWSAYPGDGENALALYRAANERLYARRVFRGYQRPDAQTATPVAPNERLTLDIRN